jgi:hypothetical protein
VVIFFLTVDKNEGETCFVDKMAVLVFASHCDFEESYGLYATVGRKSSCNSSSAVTTAY